MFFEWTQSILGYFNAESRKFDEAYQFPYVAGEERENLAADHTYARVIRGRAWKYPGEVAALFSSVQG